MGARCITVTTCDRRARQGLRQYARRETRLEVKRGKFVIELVRPGADKGGAVRAFLQEPPFTGRRPIFVGDDITDEDGMAAARDAGGFGILGANDHPLRHASALRILPRFTHGWACDRPALQPRALADRQLPGFRPHRRCRWPGVGLRAALDGDPTFCALLNGERHAWGLALRAREPDQRHHLVRTQRTHPRHTAGSGRRHSASRSPISAAVRAVWPHVPAHRLRADRAPVAGVPRLKVTLRR